MEEDMLSMFLLENIHRYFPRLPLINEMKYAETAEVKSLGQLCQYHQEHSAQWNAFRKMVKDTFPGYVVKDPTRLFLRDRCFHLTLCMDKNEDVKVLHLFVSIIVPYFHICKAEYRKFEIEPGNISFQRMNIYHEINEMAEMKSDARALSELAISKFRFAPFPIEYLHVPVQDIAVDDITIKRYDFFDALFLNIDESGFF
ncbi:hypothetical protein EGT74_04965 [Chitinophaga lutea]|uniref:Uncharacterized protein n=1 Tax=Chitinophaga lutea TaxID=2488634 RepID=A0A3N4PY65_9BACT|nr:hypothetical protein [Chitinophaga lutea]RPE12898.1 hypothetical protein EGT74_04965 [Chitinophaga lutea]